MKNDIPKGFEKPTELPEGEAERSAWQEKNYSWWQSHPMRYDWKEAVAPAEFSREFFDEIDRRFFGNAGEYLPPGERQPFGTWMGLAGLGDKDVLEMGVGNGTHAGLLAGHARSFTGIDLTDYAVLSTSRRFDAFSLKGRILKMDAEHLEFPDHSFDLVWAWGVIHHSANTRKVLEEIKRVLRPGGRAVIMVYHRGWWNYYCLGGLRALLKGDLFRTRSLHKSIQLETDGAIARYYSAADWRKTCADLFAVRYVRTTGPKSDVIPLPGGRLKRIAAAILPNFLNRFLTGPLGMGSFLVSEIRA